MALTKRPAGSLMGGLRAESQALATKKLNHQQPDVFFAVEYALPEAITQEQTQITVKFQAVANQIAGGVFDLRLLKSDIKAVP